MRIIYFDICAIPLFVMILFVCFSRKLTRGSANRLFISVVLLSLVSAVADLGMEIADNAVPLSETGRMICEVSTYTYLTLRNANLAVLLLFLLALTKTSFLIRKTWVKTVFSLPYAAILAMLVQNPFTHNAFIVTAENGYTRGPLMLAFYGIALIYGLAGLAYCIYCRRYLLMGQWISLLSVFILVHIAVLVQFFRPELLVEMFSTALGEMLIMLSIMRPEERMDREVGMLSWASFQYDLRNIILSGNQVEIVVIQLMNNREIRNYLGDHKYNEYLSEIADDIRTIRWSHRHSAELYFERPGTIYLIKNTDEADRVNNGDRLLSTIGDHINRFAENGIRFEPRFCLICCPEDLRKAEDIIRLGQTFQKIDSSNRTTLHASEIVHTQSFMIESHIEKILDRAIRENHIVMYYQPIYDVHTGKFRSAEALARIVDPEYGLIPPAIFIPAAETEGFIIPIGDIVLDQTFRFVSEHDLDALGLSYIEINLSVAQCMEKNLPEKISGLQKKYGVNPGRINLEITETTFENISEIMLENINELIRMGYSFALDDYGIGYSSIQRVNHLPLKLIKIDKSMVEELSSANGRVILEHTLRMMQAIGKKLVVEGAETKEEVDILEEMNCDYIQGYYFSHPLPENEFVHFLMEHR